MPLKQMGRRTVCRYQRENIPRASSAHMQDIGRNATLHRAGVRQTSAISGNSTRAAKQVYSVGKRAIGHNAQFLVQ